MINNVLTARYRALLATAERAVEIAIEQNEHAALASVTTLSA